MDLDGSSSQIVIRIIILREKYIYCNRHYIMSGDMQNCGEIHGDLEIDFLNR